MTGWVYVDGTSVERLKLCHCWTSCFVRRDQQIVTFSFTVPVPSPCVDKWDSNLHHLCSKPTGPVGGLSPSAYVSQVAPLVLTQLVACHPLLICHRLHHLGWPCWWLVTLCSCAMGCTTWVGPVGGLSPSAHVPQVAPLGWAKLLACHPLLMCHRLHHFGGPSCWLVTLCSCATGCTTWVGQVVGLSPSAHVPQVAPLGWAKLVACHPLLMCHGLHHLGGPPLTPDAVECYFPASTLKLAAIQPLNDCVVFAK